MLVVIPLLSAIGTMAMGGTCCSGMMGMRGNTIRMSIAGVIWLAAAAISVIALIVFAIRVTPNLRLPNRTDRRDRPRELPV